MGLTAKEIEALDPESAAVKSLLHFSGKIPLGAPTGALQRGVSNRFPVVKPGSGETSPKESSTKDPSSTKSGSKPNRSLQPMTKKLETVLSKDEPTMYTNLQKIGQGALGTIFKGETKSKEAVAIKELAVTEKTAKTIWQEIVLMKKLSHPCLVTFVGAFRKDPDHIWIVMEFMGGCTLCQILGDLHDQCPLNDGHMAKVVSNILQALQYMHEKNIIHRDVKSDNILINSKGEIKLADLGAAAELESKLHRRTSVIGSPFWMAPEVSAGVGYSFKADVWSVGIVLYEMVTGEPPYSDEPNPFKAILLLSTEGVSPILDETVSWEILSFLDLTLIINPDDRYSTADMLFHELIDKACTEKEIAEMVVKYTPAITKAAKEIEEFLSFFTCTRHFKRYKQIVN